MIERPSDALGQRINRRGLLKLAGGLSLSVSGISAFLASCGGDSSGSRGAQPSGMSPKIDASQTARPGGTLRVALTGDPPNLDMYQTTDSIVVLVASHMYETLFTW
ncbi:MAG TPA: hypothetical protein VGW38_29140, partial [Chloroflexota bacterium]|nr:hypothetical protein [Chloroflexota bacterium]